MMEEQKVIALVEAVLPGCEVFPEGQDCSFTLNVVSDSFAHQRAVARQQSVLAAFAEPLRTGELHSVSVKAFTRAEWQQHIRNQAPVQIKL